MKDLDDLPTVIDVGGDRYYLGKGEDKTVDLAYKNRTQFLATFTSPTDSNTRKEYIEYLLRKYMPYGLKRSLKRTFDNEYEKDQLLKILQKRANQLHESDRFNSSVLKNAFFKRTYLKLLEIIGEIKGEGKIEKLNAFNAANLAYLKSIPEEKMVPLILELSWFLLHPDDVPKRKVLQQWRYIIENLNTLRIEEFVNAVKEMEKTKPALKKNAPLNYFERIHVGKTSKEPTMTKSLEKGKEMAFTVKKDDDYRASLQYRLKLLLQILHAKKYLSNSFPKDEQGVNQINEEAAKSIEDRMISDLNANPAKTVSSKGAVTTGTQTKGTQTGLKGGGAQLRVMDRKIGLAMQPLFDYFRSTYDPIYGFVESTIGSYLASNSNTIHIPHLVTLLHICQSIRPAETTNGGLPSYGVYRIQHVPSDLLTYLNYLMKKTEENVAQIPSEGNKNIFNDQIYKLPHVRLTSLLNPLANPSAYKYPTDFAYYQIFTVDGNMTIPSEESFLDSSDPKLTAEAYQTTTEFLNKDNVYVVCTKGDYAREDIPMHVYTIDFTKVELEDMALPIDMMTDNFFNKKEKEDTLFFDKLVKLTPYVICNDTELALSILIAFKDLMPK
jgi:hypothetical protein